MNKRTLQIVSALMGTVPVITGLVQMMGIHDPLYASLNLPADATLDSNMRFLAGVWLGLGLASWWLVPRISEQTVLFRVLWLMIFLGGIGRLVSMASVGLPLTPFIAFTALEIVGAPLFVYWQHRVVQNS
ncbi:DUF4345 domain-containing protein [Rhodoferax sp. AJA081-3]|uniref:DUF4345 domain-containing protein n=1 Tax=Rhodoferax sp. AJA081-3 TaxID=2752316 RepID=UPI001AE0DC28|nr:DUF4345 domain-containing protein [Rhodoferax sp. AJA081-3]QTN26690.1 DUF4345 domain-containing protein [Rhodoferax sp. AJA081-3]